MAIKQLTGFGFDLCYAILSYRSFVNVASFYYSSCRCTSCLNMPFLAISSSYVPIEKNISIRMSPDDLPQNSPETQLLRRTSSEISGRSRISSGYVLTNLSDASFMKYGNGIGVFDSA